ncbi:hypothetical protein [uncultured Rhodoblastus sp.]|uniref:hypothetical protein n=1 Tax=uncultured Rhodoblastus sp. TaxID=543037 RepID=UPI0026014C24|nr:hypothetical protein [uncultured Rhodoblastus sp.]
MSKPVVVPCPHTKEEYEAIQKKIEESSHSLNAEIGKYVRAWGRIHDQFASYFAGLCGQPPMIGYPIWNALKSDLIPAPNSFGGAAS